MSKENLKLDLERLRSEVNQIADSKPDSREKLNSLITDLEKRIESETNEDDIGLMENIREHISNFEAEQPRATAILNDSMVSLSKLGSGLPD